MSAGDEVVAALARDRGGALVAYAWMLTGDRRAAEDLVQDALVKTVVRARDGADLRAVEAYVRRSILTTFVDGTRRRQRLLGLLPRLSRDADVRVEDPAGLTADQLDVRAALATLPRRERACVVLRYYDDLPLAEIAATLGISVGAVKRYLHTAVQRLHGPLGPLADLPVTTTVQGSTL